MTHHNRVDMMLTASAVSGFVPLLGQGVGVDAPLGISIHEWLSDQLAFGADYVTNRIQTIFVDGKAVDNEQNATVSNGTVIALSAAMPGLVGATLRKDGFFSSMRSDISQKASARSRKKSYGRVTLKLFNMIAREMGFRVLAHGVWISGQQMADALTSLAVFGVQTETCCRWEGEPMTQEQLKGLANLMDDLFLRVSTPSDQD